MLTLGFLAMILASQSTPVPPELETALASAGTNRSALEGAMESVPIDQRPGLIWLITHMPEADRRTLSGEYLLENVDLAYEAWNGAPWRDEISETVFFDTVLPYANINEKREAWRKSFRLKFSPLVAEAKSPTEAAAILNNRIFLMVGVKYSTERPKPDQSPMESIDAGMASCTGLSVLLVDACRSVGIPARFVGTPLWSDGSGNHSWVEIYDDGDWHFTGAAEPTGMALDKAWFQGRAEGAIEGDSQRAIFAVTWRKVPLSFPLPWKPEDVTVGAVDVTSRYRGESVLVPEGMARVRVRVLDARGDRQALPVTIRSQEGTILHRGTSRDDRFDANDHMEVLLPLGSSVQITLDGSESNPPMSLRVDSDEQLVTIKQPESKIRPEDP